MTAFLLRVLHSNIFFAFICAALIFTLYTLMRLEDGHLQHYNAIRRCVNACAESSMLQVHTDQGCYCVDLPQPLYEPKVLK